MSVTEDCPQPDPGPADETFLAELRHMDWSQYDSFMEWMRGDPPQADETRCEVCRITKRVVRRDLVNTRSDPTVIEILECGHGVWPG